MNHPIIADDLYAFSKFASKYHLSVKDEPVYPFRIPLSSYDKRPITSYGCIVKCRDRFCCLKRRFTIEYTDLLRGNYRNSHLYCLISYISEEERKILTSVPFEEQWQNHCGKESAGEPYEYACHRWASISQHLPSFFESFKTYDPEGKSKWLWHKGRIDHRPSKEDRKWSYSPTLVNEGDKPIINESPLECALREFEEESGGYLINPEWSISKDPLKESYIGTNSKEYQTLYFPFLAPDDYMVDNYNTIGQSEDTHWLTKEEIEEKFPERRKKLFFSFDWDNIIYSPIDEKWKVSKSSDD